MPRLSILAVAGALVSCAAGAQPAAPATAAAGASAWRALDPASTLVIDTSKGRIVVEMHPEFAPRAVERIILLAREHVYDGLLFHRVIDHFVDQTGNPNNHDGGVSRHPNLAPEFLFGLPPQGMDVVATRRSDGISGFIGSVPVAAVPAHGKAGVYHAWGAYCAGVAGMGRQAAPGSANSEIFFMRDPSRSLDHGYTVWGRVVQGLDVVRAITVGEPPPNPDRMVKVQLMADMAEADRPKLQVMDTKSQAFAEKIHEARVRLGADFSICDLDVPVR